MQSKPTKRSRSIRIAAAESMECRFLMSTYTVNTVSDAVNPGPGLLTLRQAIADANLHAGADTIAFSSSVFKAGSLHTVVLAQGQLVFTDTHGTTTVTGPGSAVLAINANRHRVSRLMTTVLVETVTAARSRQQHL